MNFQKPLFVLVFCFAIWCNSLAQNITLVAGDSISLYRYSNNDTTTYISINILSGNNGTRSGNYWNPNYSLDTLKANQFQLSSPYNTAIDDSGNVYISDVGNFQIYKVWKNSDSISIVTGQMNYKGDGYVNYTYSVNSNYTLDSLTDNDSLATNYNVTVNPRGIALDANRNLYIADYSHCCIWRITSTTGRINAVAGNGSVGYSGDGGLATIANLAYPVGIAFDNSGNLFIADYYNNCIRKVFAIGGSITPKSTISTIAGNGDLTNSGDEGAAISAGLFKPSGLAIDRKNNLLYISVCTNNANYPYSLGSVRKVNLNSGIITSVAGSEAKGGLYDFSYQGSDTIASFFPMQPAGLAVDVLGNLLIADPASSRILKLNIDSNRVSVVAGCNGNTVFSKNTYCGDFNIDTTATLVSLSQPTGIALDTSGYLYITNSGNSCVLKVKYSASGHKHVTGINSNSNPSTQSTIYPNPTSGDFTLSTNPPANTNTKQLLEIFDISGRRIYSQPITNQETKIQTDNLAQGIYMLSLISSEGTINKKLVIEK